MKRARFFWADIVRIISIYLVLVVHSAYFMPQLPQFFQYATLLIAKTCVPLFVMLSGFLLLERSSISKEYFLKRITKVVIPWIAWSVIAIFADSLIFHKALPSSIGEWKYRLEDVLLTRYWFFSLIVGLYLIFPAISLFIKNSTTRDRRYLLMIWFIFAGLLPYFHSGATFPLPLYGGLATSVIFFAGFAILGYELGTFIKKRSIIKMILVSLILGVIIDFLYLNFSHAPKNAATFYSYDYLSPVIIMFSITIFTLLKYVADKWERKSSHATRNFVILASSTVLGIYVLHEYFMIALHSNLIKLPVFNNIYLSFLGIIFLPLFYFFASFLAVLFLKRLPVINKLIP